MVGFDAQAVFDYVPGRDLEEELPLLGVCLGHQALVEHHGGRIWYRSRPGRSTTFYFTISEEKEEAP